MNHASRDYKLIVADFDNANSNPAAIAKRNARRSNAHRDETPEPEHRRPKRARGSTNATTPTVSTPATVQDDNEGMQVTIAGQVPGGNDEGGRSRHFSRVATRDTHVHRRASATLTPANPLLSTQGTPSTQDTPAFPSADLSLEELYQVRFRYLVF